MLGLQKKKKKNALSHAVRHKLAPDSVDDVCDHGSVDLIHRVAVGHDGEKSGACRCDETLLPTLTRALSLSHAQARVLRPGFLGRERVRGMRTCGTQACACERGGARRREREHTENKIVTS